MKRVVFDRVGPPAEVLRIQDDVPAPQPRVGEVLVRMRRVGLCGTDYHIFAGNQPFLSYPRVMGHELAGDIAAVPDGSALRVGQRVRFEVEAAEGGSVARGLHLVTF